MRGRRAASNMLICVRCRERLLQHMTTSVKIVSSLALLALLGVGVAACSSDTDTSTPKEPKNSAEQQEEAAPEPVDLDGEWKQTNANDPENFQTATVTEDTIEVYWNAPDTKSLYWAGTVEVPDDAGSSFSWDSANDTSKTEGAILASEDDTKTFTYENGELSYDVTAMGTTITVRLEPAE